MIEKKKCNITVPATDGQNDYRQRLILSIIAKTIGPTTVLFQGNSIHLECSTNQKNTIQALISKCLPELDYIVEQAILSHLRNYDLCTDEPIEIRLKYA